LRRFIHNDFDPAKDQDSNIKTSYKDRTRYYSVEGKSYPSITSVLSSDPKKRKSLAEWRKRVGEKEANKISGQASRRGTAVHQICEDYLNNKPEYINGAMPDSVEMFSSLRPILDKSLGVINAQEVALFSHRLGIAGRVDCIAEWDDTLSIIDFKTSNKPKRVEWIDDYFMQCAGYAAMYYEMTDIPIKDVVVAIMVAGEEPQIFKEKVANWLVPLTIAIKRFNKEN
jgi:ATP-dependent exoDNAse (exonuclease V) beta subunit